MSGYTLSAKITADAKNFIAGLGKAEASVGKFKSSLNSMGGKFQKLGKDVSQVGSNLTKKLTLPAVAATSALVGVTAVKGFNRLVGIDTARAKLIGLGHDAESVEVIMSSALDSVKGTAFGMDEAATTAANAVAAGIKPGKELTRYLTLTGDAAAIAGESMADMGGIINKVQTSNKAYNGELQQLSDRGLPIYQWLAEEANTTADAVFDMASNGEISSEMFLNAIEKNIGGAAKAMGENSFVAGIANIGAAIGRLGAEFLDAGGEAGGFFSTIKPMTVDAIAFIDSLAGSAQEMGVKFGNAFISVVDKLTALKNSFTSLDPSIQSLILKSIAIGTAFLVGIGPALQIVGKLMTGVGLLTSVLGFVLSPIGLIVTGVLGLVAVIGIAAAKNEDFRNKLVDGFSAIREAVSSAIEFITPILTQVWDIASEAASSFAETFGTVLSSAVDIVGTVFGSLKEILGGVASGFEGAGGGVGTLVSMFLRLNPVIGIALAVLRDFGPQVAEGFSHIGSLVIPLLTTLAEMFGQLAAAIIPMLMNVLATLIPVVMQIGMTIMEIVMAVLPVLMDIIMQLVPIITEIVTIVVEIITEVLALAAVLISAILPVIMMLIESFLNIVQAVAPALIAVLQAVIAVFRAIVPVVMAVLTVAVQVIAGVISVITPIIAFIAGVITAIVGIVAPIVSFVAGVMTSIFSVITPIIAVASGTFSSVVSIVMGSFRTIMTFIGNAISTISGIVATLSSVFSKVFNTISGIVSRVMGTVSRVISGTFSAISNAWSGLTGMVSNIFAGISSSMQTLVNQVKGFVNGVIGGINAAVGLINKIPGVNISPIPQLYRGTDNWGGGFARMNEGGRGEMVLLPSGSQVIPHDVSMKYAREAGRNQSGASASGGAAPLDSLLSVTMDQNRLLKQILDKDSDVYLDTQKAAKVLAPEITKEQEYKEKSVKRFR